MWWRKRNQAKRLQQKAFEQAKAQGKRVKLAEFEVDYRKVKKDDLIFRIMMYDHIPEEPGRKKNPKTVADTKTKLNFPPFHDNWNIYCPKDQKDYGKPYNVKNFFARNKIIAAYSHYIVAFVPRGVESKGSMSTINYAKKFGKKTLVID